MSDLSRPEFHDEAKAREWLETELWPDGPICPHCGAINEATQLHGTAHRPGVYQCKPCGQQFTVTVGTLYERSHVPLHKWLAATYLLMASKKGMSAMQISRMLELAYKTAWFLMHRIRESLRDNVETPLGGQGKFIEADEAYIGGKESNKHLNKRRKTSSRRTGSVGKEAAFALVEREGRVRSFHLPAVTASNVRQVLVTQVERDSYLMTDELGVYKTVGREFAAHETVHHGAGEYVRGDAHTNTIEGYFGILKRGIIGTYHSVSQQHLKRYLAEFDYRYNERIALGVTDTERMTKSVQGIVGKRLTYRRTAQRPNVET